MDATTYSFQYFKGFDQIALPLRSSVMVLIGRNGAGKSNLLEGIALLGALGAGKPLFELAETAVRGGLVGCPSLNETWFVLGCQRGPLRYRIVLRPEVRQVEAEGLWLGPERLYEGIEANFKNRILQVHTPTARASVSSERSVLSVYPQNFTAAAEGPGHRAEVEALKQQFLNTRLLAPQPAAMRRYQRLGLSLGPRALSEDAANLSPLLYDLSSGTPAERETLAAIVRAVQELPEEPFGELGFLRTPTDEIMLGFWPQPGPHPPDAVPPLHAGLLSDGTLRFLAILAALETVPPGTLLLIEDFDAGLHASRLARLCALLWQRCRERQITAVVTTHNATVLNGLSTEQLEGVVLCYRDQRSQSSRLCFLEEIPDSDILLSQGALGDLVTRQVIERHLMPSFTEERQASLRAWLESLP